MVEYVTIRIPVRLWWLVDGSVDNSMATDAVDGEVATLMNGACVRDAGWRASFECPGEREWGGWPAVDQELAIVLQRQHWEWVIEQLADDGAMDDTVETLIRNGLAATERFT